MPQICDHKITNKLYSLLWLHMVGNMKDAGHKSFVQLICSIKDFQSLLELIS